MSRHTLYNNNNKYFFFITVNQHSVFTVLELSNYELKIQFFFYLTLKESLEEEKAVIPAKPSKKH